MAKSLLLGVLIFLIGVLIGHSILAFGVKRDERVNSIKCTHQHKFINSLLGCEEEVMSKRGYNQLQVKIESYLVKKEKDGKLLNSSVFYKNLISGSDFAINENNYFYPASLFKLPVLVTYFRYAKKNPDILNTSIKIIDVKSQGEEQFYRPKEVLKSGNTYTVNELLRRMIVYSDNNAAKALLLNLGNITTDSNPPLRTLEETGAISSLSNPGEVIDAISYSSIFSILYNGTYLNHELSEKALEILTDSDFKEGLAAGVPQGVKIAHKFGERSGFDGDLKQLHDCGIVYFPKSPYILCVMTTGKDFKELSGIISDISKTVYEEINSRKNN